MEAKKQEIQQYFKDYVKAHPVKAKEAALKTSLQIQNSDLNLGGQYYTRTLLIPKFYTQQDKVNFDNIVDTTTGIFEKVRDAYYTDPEIRALFPFGKDLEELILHKPLYDTLIPIARIDIFYNEDTKEFAFCEFNGDGTSAMNENRRLYEFLPYNTPYTQLPVQAESMELMESWADAFMQDYAASKFRDETPVIAITDFLEKAYITELKAFEKVFADRGIQAEVVDIRNLDYKDGHLVNKETGQVYNAVYRRAVTSDVMDKQNEIQPFLQAYKDDAMVTIGGFVSQLIHHKDIFPILHNPKMQKYLSPEEIAFVKAHVPATMDLTPESAKLALENKDAWIIKPKDSYAAKGVFAGVDLTHKEWEMAVHDYMDHDYILQSYITPYKTENIDLINYDAFMPYSNLTGLYAYNGKFAGVYSRMADGGIISTQYNEKTVPTLFLKDE